MNEIEIVIRARNEASKVLNQFSADLSKTIGTAASQLKQIGVISGGVIAAGFGSSIIEAAKFEDRLLGVVAKVGETGASFNKLSEIALQFGRDTKFSTLEAADGLEILAQLGVKTEQDFTNLLNASGNLAVALKTDLANATGLIQTQLNTFGLEAGKAAEVADLLTAAANNSALSAEKLGVALQYAGPAAAASNTSLQETLAVMGALSNRIPQASKVGNTFKQFIQTLVKPTAEAEKTLALLSARLGENIDITQKAGESTSDYNARIEPVLATLRDRWNPEIQGVTNILKDFRDANITTSESVAVFGRIHGTNVKLLANAADSIDQITDAMGKSLTAYEQAQKQLEGLKGQYDLLFGSVKVLQTLIGTEFLKAFADLTKQITATLNEFVNVGTEFNFFNSSISKIVISIQNLVGSITGLNSEADKTVVAMKAWEIFNTFNTSLAAMIQYIANLITAMKELNDETGIITKATEFYISIAKGFITVFGEMGEAVLSASGYLADFITADTETRFKMLRDLVGEVYEKVKTFIDDGISRLNEIDFSSPLSSISSFLVSIAGITTVFVTVVGAVKAFIDVMALIPGVKLLTTVPLGAATAAFNLLAGGITTVIGVLNPFTVLAVATAAAIGAAWKENFIGIQDAVKTFQITFESTGNIFKAFDLAASTVINKVKEIASSLKSEIPNAAASLTSGLDKLYQAFKTFTDGVENLFKGNINDAIDDFGLAFEQAYDTVSTAMPGIVELISNELTKVQDYIENFDISGFTGAWGKAGELIQTAFDGMKQVIITAIDAIKLVIEGDFQGAVDLIPDIFGQALDAIGPLFETAKGIITDLIAEYGPAISEKAQDIIGSIGDIASGVIDSLSDVVGQGLDALIGYLKDFNPDDALSATSVELSGFLNVITTEFGKVFDSLGEFVSQNLPKIIDIISGLLSKAETVWDEFLPVVTKAFSAAVKVLADFIVSSAPALIQGAGKLIRQAIDFIVKFLTTDMKTELAPGADGLAKALGTIFSVAFDEAKKILGTAISGLGSVIGKLISDIVGTISGDNSFSTLFAEWGLKIAAVTAAFNALFGIGIVSFLTTIGTGIVTVVGYAVSLGKTILGLLPSFETAGKVFQAFKLYMSLLGESLLGVFNVLKGGAASVLNFVKGFTSISGIADTVVTAFKTVGTALLAVNPILAGVAAAVTAVYFAWKTNLFGIGDIINDFLQGVFSWLIDAWEKLPDVISTAWTAIKNVTTSAFTAISDFIIDTWEAMILTVMDIIESMVNGITAAWTGLKTGISTALTAVSDLIKTAWEGLKNLTVTAFNGIKDTIVSIMDYATNKIKTAADAIIGFFKRIIDYIKEWAVNIYDSVSKAVGKVVDFITGIGSKMYDGAVKTFNSWIDGAKDALSKGKKVVTDALGKIGKLLIGNSPPPEGPLSMIDTGGFNVASAWVDGMTTGLNDSQSVIASSLGDMTSMFDSAGIESAMSLENSLASGLANVQTNISATAASIGKIIDSSIPAEISSRVSLNTSTSGLNAGTASAAGLPTGNNLLTAPLSSVSPALSGGSGGDTYVNNIDMGGQVINTPLDYTALRSTMADDITRSNRQRYGTRTQSKVVAR